MQHIPVRTSDPNQRLPDGSETYNHAGEFLTQKDGASTYAVAL